jgi:trans-aconitate methyltransferase
MSRLDTFIRRLQAQRLCLDALADRLQGLPGPVLELGLGNGRTYDHLRERFPGRPIFVFDRQVAAHPDCIPPADQLRLGDFRETLPAYAAEGQPPAALIHADIGSGDKAASMQLAADLAPSWARILAPGGFLASDQPIELPLWTPVPLPPGVDAGRYHLYCREN